MNGADGLPALLAREGASLVARLRSWTPVRWAAATGRPSLTRADVAHHLAQDLADRAAVAECGPGRALPRLDSDLALPDQLAVCVDDVVHAAPPGDDVRRALAHLLLHRTELLADDVPAGVSRALRVDDVLALGRQSCAWTPAV